MHERYDIAAYVWPAYTGKEARTKMFWPQGMGEWESVARAYNTKKLTPEGGTYCWGREPLWGMRDEADPQVMAEQIDIALKHQVNVFIYDSYWYDGRPMLEQCLDEGFLPAVSGTKMKFYLMWANHDANNVWDYETSELLSNVIWRGQVSTADFEKLSRHYIEKYFLSDAYYCIKQKPVFSIYDLENFVQGCGGLSKAVKALEQFRGNAEKAGLPGLHLQGIAWGRTQNYSGIDAEKTMDFSALAKALTLDSITHYQYVHFTDIDRNYKDIMRDVVAEWEHYREELDVPYFPHISVGWDNNPRFKVFRPGIVRENQPAAIKEALLLAKNHLDSSRLSPKLLTINSWNEWTETSYLQPDNIYGEAYLKAIKEVFS